MTKAKYITIFHWMFAGLLAAMFTVVFHLMLYRSVFADTIWDAVIVGVTFFLFGVLWSWLFSRYFKKPQE
jgi:hypothetical protein